MEWLMNEKIKHRVIGFAVILSLAVIFLPAMVKKSNQRLDRKMNFSINVPDKPKFPEVTAVKPKEVFKEVAVAHVVIPDVVEKRQLKQIAEATSLSKTVIAQQTSLQQIPAFPKQTSVPQTKIVKVASPGKVIVAKMVPSKPLPINVPKSNVLKKDVFSVQLASFTQQRNAAALVQLLKQKGFNASYDHQGKLFRVLVGELKQLEQAKNLQRELTGVTQLNGFIIKVG